MSVEGVALRAVVHKATVYRCWGTKDRLLAEARRAIRQAEIGSLDNVEATAGFLYA